MKILLAIFKYFPSGGAQRDMLSIARELAGRGHDVTIACGAWEGEKPSFADVVVLKTSGWSNHARAKSIARQIGRMRGRFDRVAGFNRMSGLDWYFAADVCFGARPLGWKRLLPRNRAWLALERAVFAPEAKTRILALTVPQVRSYKEVYRTPEKRFVVLPPGVSAVFKVAPAPRNERLELLLIGADFHTKGADRALEAIARLPEEFRAKLHLTLAGDDRRRAEFIRLAEKLGLAACVTTLGAVDDVPQRMASADILLHPARREAAGNVLAEAAATGLPAICSECCGYADIVSAGGGVVLPEPFDGGRLEAILVELLTEPGYPELLRQTAIRYAGTLDYSRRASVAAEAILQ